MTRYVGLDASLKETKLHVLDAMRDLRFFDATNPLYFQVSLYMEAIK
jgi:hypothetical protein